MAASMGMLRGTVIGFTNNGMLVHSHFGSVNIPNAIKDYKNRPPWQNGYFLLTGHPKQANKANDDWFDVDAVYEGISEYPTLLGIRRIQTFRVLKAYY
jgi:hypothetical protein